MHSASRNASLRCLLILSSSWFTEGILRLATAPSQSRCCALRLQGLVVFDDSSVISKGMARRPSTSGQDHSGLQPYFGRWQKNRTCAPFTQPAPTRHCEVSSRVVRRSVPPRESQRGLPMNSWWYSASLSRAGWSEHRLNQGFEDDFPHHQSPTGSTTGGQPEMMRERKTLREETLAPHRGPPQRPQSQGPPSPERLARSESLQTSHPRRLLPINAHAASSPSYSGR